MRLIWTWRAIDAPAAVVWRVLTDLDQWPAWGPTVRAATLHRSDDADPGLMAGARGTITTIVGVDLPFEITEVTEGRSWSWQVAGVAATSHAVEPVAAACCRAGFGVPLPAAPYLAVCAVALRRIERLAADPPTRR